MVLPRISAAARGRVRNENHRIRYLYAYYEGQGLFLPRSFYNRHMKLYLSYRRQMGVGYGPSTWGMSQAQWLSANETVSRVFARVNFNRMRRVASRFVMRWRLFKRPASLMLLSACAVPLDERHIVIELFNPWLARQVPKHCECSLSHFYM